MSYSFWANATAITHIIIIVGVLIGLLVSFRYKRFRPFEAGALILIVLLWSYYGNCPLTIIEQYFRDLAGQSSNLTSIGFLPYYAHKFFDLNFTSNLVKQSTFFTGGVFFTASIEWLSPFFHFHLFHFRKSFKRKLGHTFSF